MQTQVASLLAVIALFLPQVYASNFTFSYGNASQCEDFNISWTGGTAPYKLSILSQAPPKAYSIPSSSYSNGHGFYQLQLALNASTALDEDGQSFGGFVAVMSDASGFGSGGVTDMIYVDPGNSNCDLTVHDVPFTFATNQSVEQCSDFQFNDYAGAVQPLTIYGIIPGGETFILNVPNNSDHFDWQANVAAGTTLTFIMNDSEGRSGGNTPFLPVGTSGDSSCLTGAYPSSLLHPSETSTSGATSTTSTGAATNTTTNVTTSSTPTGAIVGGVVGGVVGLGLIVAVIFIYLRRERHKRRHGQSSAFASWGARRKNDDIDLTEGGDYVPPPDAVQPYPYYDTHSPAQQSSTGNSAASLMRSTSYVDPHGYMAVAVHSRSNSLVGDASALAGMPGARGSGSQSQDQSQSTTSSASRRKAAIAGVTPHQPNPQRLVLHTDAEDVVELPPQYSSLWVPSAITEATTADSQRASSSDSVPPVSSPPPLITVLLPTAAFDTEEHPHAGLQEPPSVVPLGARTP
ncbi:hypothetical protein DAEQUDRAFT_808793 [Daedalea quercina L-15889]|uniref:Mid2 domain-containing protein n=1 Tax=Daedalea quercina L-15889 TaxID=1314783 RepID=A0A165T207_9APHY|nr:hypothetical protein DAEQUDRAFT_808793 [Daedalea quercina L-15889]